VSVTPRRVPAAASCAAVILAALTAAPAAATPPSPSPEATVPGWLDKAVSSRDVACVVSVTPETAQGADVVVAEQITCTVAMSDAMVEGDLSAEITVTFAPAASGAGTWVGDFSITGDDASWVGDGSGAAVRGAAGSPPALYGEVFYRGSGDCEGLRYGQLLAAPEGAPASLSGWIRGPVEPTLYWRIARLPLPWVDALTFGQRNL
jgi:hypothetical protein